MPGVLVVSFLVKIKIAPGTHITQLRTNSQDTMPFHLGSKIPNQIDSTSAAGFTAIIPSHVIWINTTRAVKFVFSVVVKNIAAAAAAYAASRKHKAPAVESAETLTCFPPAISVPSLYFAPVEVVFNQRPDAATNTIIAKYNAKHKFYNERISALSTWWLIKDRTKIMLHR
jgi:hypothetical protein